MSTDSNKDKNKGTKASIRSIVASDNYSLRRGTNAGTSDFVVDEDDEWVNVIVLLQRLKGNWVKSLINDDIRIRIQFFVTYAVLGIVALGMTILNAFTAWKLLGASTLAFFLLSALNCVLCLISEKTEKIAQVLFGFEIVGLFSFFAIVGNPEGFSILWSLMLPTCGMLLFRARYGSIVALGQWLVLIFLFWTPIGKSILMYDYTVTFLQRFPVLYLACFLIGFFFELIRYNTHAELISARGEFEYLYKHDALTGLYNRYGLNAELAKATATGKRTPKAFAIMDLDYFKRTNDTYGHLIGDEVLKTAAGIIKDTVGSDGHACRWGGEEFSVIFFDENKAEEICHRINEACAAHEYNFNGKRFRNTISIGLVLGTGEELPQSSGVITQADDNLYTSKTTGRNKVTTTVLRDGGTPSPGQETDMAS